MYLNAYMLNMLICFEFILMITDHSQKKFKIAEQEKEGIVGQCEFNLGDIYSDKTNKFEQKITFSVPNGTGENSDQNSSLVRVFNRIIYDGKKVGSMKYVFYVGNDNTWFTLGTFVKSKKRILFFPGLRGLQITTFPSGYSSTSDTLHVDHISLEQNLRKYHITVKEKNKTNKRIETQTTKRLDDSLFLWLVLAARTENQLERTAKKTQILLQSPTKNEAKRRANEIMDSRKDTVFNVIKLRQRREDIHYLNFEIFISDKRLEHYPEISNFYTAQNISSYKDPQYLTYSRICCFSLRDFVGTICIRVVENLGSLEPEGALIMEPCVLRPK